MKKDKTDKEMAQPTKGLLKRFLSYYKPHKKLFFLDMLASFLISAIGLSYPIITRTI